MHRTTTALFCLLLVTAAPARAGEERLTCPMGREFFLYAPDDAASKTRWLVVGVHGYRGDGRGAAGLASWASRDDVVVVGPSFPDGYQGLGLESDAQLVGVFSEMKKRFRMHPKLFVHGFSGGAQFAHRFALAHPDLVAGCSAHSGGTWEDRVNPAAVGVPFAISCGENDTGKSMPSSPLGRFDWFKAFVGRLNDGSFSFKARTWPGVGHEASPGAARMTEECFLLATTGMHEPEREAVRAEIGQIDRLITAGRRDEARKRIGLLTGPGAKPKPAARPGSKGTPKSVPADAATTGKDAGAVLSGVEEDSFGWRLTPAGREALAAAREAFVKQATEELTARIESAGARPRGKPQTTR